MAAAFPTDSVGSFTAGATLLRKHHATAVAAQPGDGVCQRRILEYTYWNVSGDRDHTGGAVRSLPDGKSFGKCNRNYLRDCADVFGLRFATDPRKNRRGAAAGSAGHETEDEWHVP